MASVEEFVDSPCDHLLDQCSKEQLLKIAEHYKVEIGDKRVKLDTIKANLRKKLVATGVLEMEEKVGSASLDFEQQKELLMMQLQHDEWKHKKDAELKLELEKNKNANGKGKVRCRTA